MRLSVRSFLSKSNLPRRFIASTLRDVKEVTISFKETPLVTTIRESSLPNGIKVVTLDRPLPVSSLSLFVKAGSRYETRSTSGATHFLKYFASQNNAKKSGLRLVRDLEHYGTTVNVDIGREYINYNISLARFQTIETKIAAETLKFLLSPLLLEYEVTRLRDIVSQESQELCEMSKLLELAHSTAFRDQGLGQSLYAQPHSIEHIDGRHLHRHLTQNFVANNMVIVGTGMEHTSLRDVIDSLFSGDLVETKNPEFTKMEPLKVDLPTLQTFNWTGGEVRQSLPGETQLLIAYPGAARNTKDEMVHSIIKEYLDSLCLNETVSQSNSCSLSYSDCGLFAFYVVASEGTAGNTLNLMHNTIKNLTNISADDFETSKLKAKTKHLHKLSNVFALANQISHYGKVNNSNEINSVTQNDFRDTVSRLTKASPVVVASGDVRGINKL